MQQRDYKGVRWDKIIPGAMLILLAIGILIVVIAGLASFREYLASLTGTPWWLVPAAVGLTVLLAAFAYTLYRRAGTARPRLEAYHPPSFFDNTLLKTLLLAGTVSVGSAVAYHIGASPALLRYESEAAMQHYLAQQAAQSPPVIDLARQRKIDEAALEELERQELEREKAARLARLAREQNEAAQRVVENLAATKRAKQRERDELLAQLLNKHQQRESIPYYNDAEAICKQVGLSGEWYAGQRDRLEQTYQATIDAAQQKYQSTQDARFYRACYLAAMKINWPEKALDHLTLLETNLPSEASWVTYRKSMVHYMSFGQYAKALDLIDKALATDPQNATYRQLRGMCLWRVGRLQESVKEFQSAQHYLNEEILHFLRKDSRSVFVLASQQLASPHARRYGFYQLWFYAVSNPQSHAKLMALETTSQANSQSATSLAAIMNRVRPWVTEIGLLQQTPHDRDVYQKFCAENNLQPGLLETIWAAALASSGNYEAAQLFARRSVEISSGDARREAQKHWELYKKNQPLRSTDHTRILFQNGMKDHGLKIAIPAIVADIRT